MHLASFLTDFADQAVLLPLAVVVAIALYAAGWRRGALAWAGGVIVVLGVMLVLKLGSMACGQILLGRELRSPSGHTAAAAAVYGALIPLLLGAPGRGWLRLLPAVTIAVIIGGTRIALGDHTDIEVVIGGVVGVGAAYAILRLAGQPPSGIRLSPMILIVIVLTIFAFYGLRMNAEAAIGTSPLLHWWPLSLCTTS